MPVTVLSCSQYLPIATPCSLLPAPLWRGMRPLSIRGESGVAAGGSPPHGLATAQLGGTHLWAACSGTWRAAHVPCAAYKGLRNMRPGRRWRPAGLLASLSLSFDIDVWLLQGSR